MDYEKAYKAVLKTATQWIKDGCTDKEKICLECVFPELRESEDERMVRKIESFLSAYGADYFSNDEWREIEVWLEKQKEPHFTKRNALFDECVAKCDPAIMKTVSDKVDEMLGKEQKPAWSEEDEEILDGIINTLDRLGYAEFCKSLREEDIEEERFYYKEIQFLKRLKSLRPSWKPSEEQMSALNHCAYETCRIDDKSALQELYEQL